MADSAIPANWHQILEGLGNNQLGLEIIRFLYRHPHMGFTSGAITLDGDYTRSDILQCLDILAGQGIIEATAKNGTIIYHLAEDTDWRETIISSSLFELRRSDGILGYRFTDGKDTICG